MGRILRHQLTENDQNVPSDASDNPNDKGDKDFVGRVASIPLVKDSVSTAQKIAKKTTIGRYALSTANSTFNTVADFAAANQPKYFKSYYQTYLQPQIVKADAFGCRSLDSLQSKVPIINQPSYQIIDDVKVRIDKTIKTVTHPAQVVAENANKTFSTAVDNFESVVDKYLPPPSSNGHSNSSEMNGNAQQQANKDIVSSNDNQVKRVYGVLNRVSRRLTVKVSDQISRSTSGLPKSRQDVYQLALVKNLQEKIKFIQGALRESVKVYTGAAQKHLPDSVTNRAFQANTAIQQQVDVLVTYIKAPQVPAWLKKELTTVVGKIDQQMASIKQEFGRTDINYTAKVKGVASQLQKQVVPLLKGIINTPLEYVGMSQKIKVE